MGAAHPVLGAAVAPVRQWHAHRRGPLCLRAGGKPPQPKSGGGQGFGSPVPPPSPPGSPPAVPGAAAPSATSRDEELEAWTNATFPPGAAFSLSLEEGQKEMPPARSGGTRNPACGASSSRFPTPLSSPCFVFRALPEASGGPGEEDPEWMKAGGKAMQS